MNKSNKFSPEVRERAMRMVQEHRGEYPSLWAAVESITPKIGCVPQTLLDWVKRQEVDTGVREGVTTTEVQCVKDLEREVKELRRANEILKLASAFFAQAELGPPTQVLMDFIDEHRATHGVEPICKVLQVAPSGYRRRAALRRDPQKRCAICDRVGTWPAR
jgi:transposase-like protein